MLENFNSRANSLSENYSQLSRKFIQSNIPDLKEQDGPSLESSSYLNVTFRYLGPCDPWGLICDIGD